MLEPSRQPSKIREMTVPQKYCLRYRSQPPEKRNPQKLKFPNVVILEPLEHIHIIGRVAADKLSQITGLYAIEILLRIHAAHRSIMNMPGMEFILGPPLLLFPGAPPKGYPGGVCWNFEQGGVRIYRRTKRRYSSCCRIWGRFWYERITFGARFAGSGSRWNT